MSRRLFLAAFIPGYVVVGAFFVWAVTNVAHGQEHHHPFHEDFYSKWQRPKGMGSCCNARKLNEDGTEVGDCSPTYAELRRDKDGALHWWAQLPHNGPMEQVPEDVIIHEINPDPTGQDAHLCWNMGNFYCFVPPFGGG